MCNIALVTFLGLQYWSSILTFMSTEKRAFSVSWLLSLLKPTKVTLNFLKIWSWSFTSCCWEPCKWLFLPALHGLLCKCWCSPSRDVRLSHFGNFGIVLKRTKQSSRFLHQRIAQTLPEIQKEVTQSEDNLWDWGGYELTIFDLHHVSKMVQDRT